MIFKLTISASQYTLFAISVQVIQLRCAFSNVYLNLSRCILKVIVTAFTNVDICYVLEDKIKSFLNPLCVLD